MSKKESAQRKKPLLNSLTETGRDKGEGSVRGGGRTAGSSRQIFGAMVQALRVPAEMLQGPRGSIDEARMLQGHADRLLWRRFRHA